MDQTLTLRLTAQEKQEIEFAAIAEDQSASEFVRAALQEKMARMPDQYRQAMALLKKPRTVTDQRETYTVVQNRKKSGVKTP